MLIAYFLHLVGIIIALGAVTVIDTLGFLGKKSLSWTQTTIQAHYVTKPLIWIGTTLITLSWAYILLTQPLSALTLTKTVLLIILILNGLFLSFSISPQLGNYLGKKTLLPQTVQNKIFTSFIISFIGWWSFVLLTTLELL